MSPLSALHCAMTNAPAPDKSGLHPEMVMDGLRKCGFVIVPIEPTESMIEAGENAPGGTTDLESVYRAMLGVVLR